MEKCELCQKNIEAHSLKMAEDCKFGLQLGLRILSGEINGTQASQIYRARMEASN